MSEDLLSQAIFMMVTAFEVNEPLATKNGRAAT